MGLKRNGNKPASLHPQQNNGNEELLSLLGKNTKQKAPKKRLILLIGGGVMLLGAAAALLFILPKSQQTSGETVYREYTVSRGDVTVGQSESSSISLNRETVTFPVSATVEEVYVKAGSSVKAGDPLVRLNLDDISSGLSSYELQLEIAGLQLEQAKLQLETKLLQAKQQLETSKETGSLASSNEALTLNELQLALEQAQSSLASAQKEYEEYCVLNASFDSDYSKLLRLEQKVEDWKEEVEDLEEALSSVSTSTSKLSSAQSGLESAWSSLKSAAATLSTSAEFVNALANLSTGATTMDDLVSQVGDYYNMGSSSPGSATLADSSVLTNVSAALGEAVSLYASSTGTSTAVDSYVEKFQDAMSNMATYSHRVQKYTDSAQEEEDEAAGLQEDLNDAKETLSYWQQAYDDFKEEYTQLYGNVTDGEALADKVTQAQQAMEQAQLSLDKAVINAQTGATSAEQKAQSALTGASTAQTTYELTEMELSQAVDAAQEEYDYLEDQIEEVKSMLSDDGIVYAACNGMVASINVEQGDSVSVLVDGDTNQIMAYATLLTMTNISDVYVPITISEEDILDVSIGQKASVTMNAFPNRTFDAEVDTITVESSRSGAATVSYTVNIRFSEENELDMFEGMSAEITLIQRIAQDVLYVSNQAVSNTDGVATVLKKGEDGLGVVTQVTTGFSDGRYVEILSGLQEGDVVLVESAVGRS